MKTSHFIKNHQANPAPTSKNNQDMKNPSSGLRGTFCGMYVHAASVNYRKALFWLKRIEQAKESKLTKIILSDLLLVCFLVDRET